MNVIISSLRNNILLWIIFSAFLISCSYLDEDNLYIDPEKLSESLPIIRIETKNEAQISEKEYYVSMTFSLVDSNNSSNKIHYSRGDVSVSNGYISYSKEDIFASDGGIKGRGNDTWGGIRGRGNNTWSYPKKPYRIKFDKKISLFGLEAAKNWILLAEYRDPTLIMNAVAFELGRNVFELPYTHSYHHVHLFLNGEYRGVYGLTEHNEVGRGRVDIDEEDGWFVKIDSYFDEEPKFRTKNYDLPIMIKSPEVDNNQINNPIFDFVKKDINELCDSLASENFPENGYRDLINMDTFIDFLMVNEIVLNGELIWPKSTYSYKDEDGKISMGTLWDFDWAFGYDENSNSFFTLYKGHNSKNNSNAFFKRFFEDPIFEAKFKERWNEKYAEILNINDFIDSLGTKLEQAAEYNFKIWDSSNSYSEQIENMKEWWSNRVNWLNTEINS